MRGCEEQGCAWAHNLFLSSNRHCVPGMLRCWSAGNVTEIGRGQGAGTTLNIPLPPGSGGGAYRAVFDRVVAPALDAFQPQLILVSAGVHGLQQGGRGANEGSTCGCSGNTWSLLTGQRHAKLFAHQFMLSCRTCPNSHNHDTGQDRIRWPGTPHSLQTMPSKLDCLQQLHSCLMNMQHCQTSGRRCCCAAALSGACRL